MTSEAGIQDAIRVIEIVIWPLCAIVAMIGVGAYQLARLAITRKGMERPGERENEDRGGGSVRSIGRGL